MKVRLPFAAILVLMVSNPGFAFGDSTASKCPNDPDYVIGPQDTLAINVWKEPEVSGQVVVRLDGKISLPLINDLEAAGRTPLQLASVITQRLKEYVTDPRVTVTPVCKKPKRMFVPHRFLPPSKEVPPLWPFDVGENRFPVH